MHVLVIGTLYEPDLGPASLWTLLSENLVLRGHQVTVITMVPHYPTGRVSDGFSKKLIFNSIENGVHVIRIGLPSVDRSRLPKRFLQYFCYQVGAIVMGMGLEYDAVIAANPFLTVWLPFTWTVVFRGKPALYSVQDVYPNVGIMLGIFRHKLVISAATRLERFCLNHSSIVQIISESFRSDLQALGVDDSKMVLVYNWVDTDLIHPLNRINSFAEEYKLIDRFVVLYAGNIGRSQGLEQVLDVAEQMLNKQDIQFIFVGDGSAREFLMAQAKQRQLSNVQFLPFQPREHLPEVLASADISLVTLSKGIGSRSLPSKIYSIFASGRPVLASVDEGCETWKLVEQSNAGCCVPPENPTKMAAAILALKEDKNLRDRLGRNGRIWAEKYHSPQSAAAQFENLLSAAIASHKSRKSKDL